MADVFISYSRKDQDFVRRLHEALAGQGRDTWVDWEGIPPTAEWMKEIHAAIEAADTFVFVISPDATDSETCKLEVEHAAEQHKRLVPVVYRDVPANDVPETLTKLNWIFFREQDDFNQSFQSLLKALDTDLDWVHDHTRLLVRAAEWDREKRDSSYTLRGRDLKEAEEWLSASPDKEPTPTSLQTHYIFASRKAATNRHRMVFGSVAAAVLVAVTLSLVAYFQNREKTRQQEISAARQLINRSEVLRQTPLDQPGVSTAMRASARSAAQALARFEALGMHSLDADQAIRKAIELLPGRIAEWKTGTGSVKAAGFDPSGRYAAVVHVGEHIGVWDLVAARLVTSWESTTEVGESTRAVAVAAGGEYMVLSRYNSSPDVDTTTLTIRRLPEGAPIASFQEKGMIDRGLRLDPKGRYVFIVDGLNTWGSNLRNGERLPAPTVDAVIYDMAFSANGAYLASVLRMKGKREFAVQIVDPATGEEVNRWALPERGTSVHWSPDATELAVGFKNVLSRYDARSGLALDTYARSENPAAESAGGHLVAARVKDTYLLRVSSLSGGTDIVHIPLGGELKAAAFQPAAGTLATLTVGSENRLAVWALRNRRTVAEIALESPLTEVEFDDDSRVLYIGNDKRADCRRLPDSPPADGRLEQIDGACARARSRPHRVLMDNSLGGLPNDGRVEVVDGAGKIVWKKQVPTPPLFAASNFDGRLVALMQGASTRAGMRLSIEVWGIESRQPIASITDPDLLLDYRRKPYMTFSPDGRYLATPGRNGVIVWETTTFTRAAEIYQADVVKVALQPRGSSIAVLGGDDAIHVWDIRIGEEIARLMEVGVISAFAVSPDGRWIVTLDAGGILRLWAIQPEDLIAQACAQLRGPCP
jgi:WD40 repeat protein